MATKILNTLDSTSEKMLKNVNKQLKEEAGKQLIKYKALIPTKENRGEGIKMVEGMKLD